MAEYNFSQACCISFYLSKAVVTAVAEDKAKWERTKNQNSELEVTVTPQS